MSSRPPQTHKTPTGFSWESSGNEELIYPLVRRGILRIDEHGRIWRNYALYTTKTGCTRGRQEWRRLEEPVRAECVTWHADGRRRGDASIVEVRILGRAGKITCSAARLVWMHLWGPIAPGMRVVRINLDPRDNSPANLALRSVSGSMQMREGATIQRRPALGERNGNARLCAVQVRAMRAMKRLGARLIDLREIFGINTSTAHSVVSGRTWGHVEDSAAAPRVEAA